MVILEAANRVLEFLEQEHQEEYTSAIAIQHVSQAIHELCEENEFSFMNAISSYTLETPAEGSESDLWLAMPGRAPVTSVLSVTPSEFSYIKKAWIDINGQQGEFLERDLGEMLSVHGDSSGVPQYWAIDGEYIFWRPIAPAGVDYVTRWRWQKMTVNPSSSSEPMILAQMPYAVIYRACAIASIWLLDDNRVPIFKALSDEALQRYIIRNSMTNDGQRSMEEFNG